MREMDLSLTGLVGSDDDVTFDVRWDRAVDALVGASRRSSLLVLSRRPISDPIGAHLGALTRAVLHHAACPVLVVDRWSAGQSR